MKRIMKSVAVVIALAMIFSISGVAEASTNHRRDNDNGDKVVTAVAVAALAGLTYYAMNRDDHRPRTHVSVDYRSGYRSPSVAVGIGFESYSVGSPYQRHHRRQPGGYWHNQGQRRFYRVPYRYNSHYDRSYNAGWERGYWAGYLQGMNDRQYGYRYNAQFNWQGQHLWGYTPGYGGYSNYQRAFHMAFAAGYRHAFYGSNYGHENFGYSGYYR